MVVLPDGRTDVKSLDEVDKNDWFLIEIEDSGMGIPQAALNLVFAAIRGANSLYPAFLAAAMI